MKKLTIIIPVYNEQSTIYEVLQTVVGVQLIEGVKKEIIVINDCSSDNSVSEIHKFIQHSATDIIMIDLPENKGKGGAIHSGIDRATGDYIIIQDADLELNPNEINLLIAPVCENRADIVYGSRYLRENSNQKFGLSTIANNFLTALSNLVFRLKITDMETCYKLMPTQILKQLSLQEQKFGFEPEVTARLAKIKSLRWLEVPVSYVPRNVLQGKKIGWRDGIRAIVCIIKYGWFASAQKQPSPNFESK